MGYELITTDKKPFQRYWSTAVHEALFRSLKADAPRIRLARNLTAAQGQSGDCITAHPIAQLGTRLDDETLRISVAVRVGLNVCFAHQCRCGATVQPDGLHPLSCRFRAGRFPKHFAINSIIKDHLTPQAFTPFSNRSASIDATAEDQLSGVFPFKGDKALAWYATCTESLSTSNLYSTNLNPGSASRAAEDLKRRTYYSTCGRLRVCSCGC